MKRTTGAEETARSMAERTSVERGRVLNSDEEMRGRSVAPWVGVLGERAEKVARRACGLS
jgi:hypothetical protein